MRVQSNFKTRLCSLFFQLKVILVFISSMGYAKNFSSFSERKLSSLAENFIGRESARPVSSISCLFSRRKSPNNRCPVAQQSPAMFHTAPFHIRQSPSTSHLQLSLLPDQLHQIVYPLPNFLSACMGTCIAHRRHSLHWILLSKSFFIGGSFSLMLTSSQLVCRSALIPGPATLRAISLSIPVHSWIIPLCQDQLSTPATPVRSKTISPSTPSSPSSFDLSFSTLRPQWFGNTNHLPPCLATLGPTQCLGLSPSSSCLSPWPSQSHANTIPVGRGVSPLPLFPYEWRSTPPHWQDPPVHFPVTTPELFFHFLILEHPNYFGVPEIWRLKGIPTWPNHRNSLKSNRDSGSTSQGTCTDTRSATRGLRMNLAISFHFAIHDFCHQTIFGNLDGDAPSDSQSRTNTCNRHGAPFFTRFSSVFSNYPKSKDSLSSVKRPFTTRNHQTPYGSWSW